MIHHRQAVRNLPIFQAIIFSSLLFSLGCATTPETPSLPARTPAIPIETHFGPSDALIYEEAGAVHCESDISPIEWAEISCQSQLRARAMELHPDLIVIQSRKTEKRHGSIILTMDAMTYRKKPIPHAAPEK